MDLTNKIHENFISGIYDEKGFAAILRRERSFGVSPERLKKALESLVKDKKIFFADGKYYAKKLAAKNALEKVKDNAEYIEGVLRTNEKGFGFITVEGGKDYYVAPENMAGAFTGDRVKAVKIYGRGSGDSARIVKVIARGLTSLVGTFFTEGAFSYVRPDEKGYVCDIYIPDGAVGGATTGDKVFTEITDYPKNSCPRGKVVSVIGREYQLDTEETSIIYAHDLYKDFSDETKILAAGLNKEIADNAVIGRLNLENELIFTIDGDTAKDFDDAVSLKTDENGCYELGVHIADVSEYVLQGSAIDKDALSRGTSVYFPDRVIPMLPFDLSNGVCSLSQGVRRLTVSVFCKIDPFGNVVDTRMEKSFIRSRFRLTYREVDEIFAGNEEVAKRFEDAVETLFEMKRLSEILGSRRKEEGYIDLEVKETDVDIKDGKIVLSEHKATAATKLIEQFMITANEAVAAYLYYQELPCVYRIHEKPLKEKTEALKEFVNALGVKFNPRRDECYPKDFSSLLDKVKGKPYGAVVNRIVLRSLQKAKYSTDNEGHFGLASKCYCHFTSPIRRYPDLLVHRALKDALDGKIYEKIDLYADFFASSAARSSERERNAEEAEREVDDLYKAKYLEERIGEEFSGVISGVNGGGAFVEIENGCEGLVPIELFPKGVYEYEKDKFALVGKNFVFAIGKSVKIVVVGVDMAERKAQFAFTDIKSCRAK